MARRTNLLLLTLSFALAFISTLVIVKSIKGKMATHLNSSPMASVLVVTQALNTHQLVTASDVRMEKIPAAAVQSGSVTSTSDAVGHFTTTAWFPGQQVIQGMVASLTDKQSFTLTIPRGEVAFTIPDDPVAGVDHLISIGDRVNVLVAYPKENGAPSERTVVRDIQVLGVDAGPVSLSSAGATGAPPASSTASSPDTVTLALTPKQSDLLDYAYAFGQIHIALQSGR